MALIEIHNPLVLCLYTATVSMLLLFALRFGREMTIALLAMLSVAMNLFVLKQITIFGLHVTSSDALAVGYLLGLNLIQEFFGQKCAKRCVWISFFVSMSFVLVSQVHLSFTPNTFDHAHAHFEFLFKPLPRLILASLCTFLFVQFVDLSFFGYLRKRTNGRFLTMRTLCALILSQTLDTLLFSFLGLYGLVVSISHVILMSLAAKALVIILTTPFISFSKRMIKSDVPV